MSFSERIIQCRTKKGLSQNQLAKLMEVSRQAVSKWENGLSVPDAAKMIQLAEIFEVSWDYLATGRENPVSPTPELQQSVEPVMADPVIEYVDRIVVKRVIRKQYIRHPIEYILVALIGFGLGIVLGLCI